MVGEEQHRLEAEWLRELRLGWGEQHHRRGCSQRAEMWLHDGENRHYGTELEGKQITCKLTG